MNTRPTYTPADLVPKQAGPFNKVQYRDDKRRQQWNPNHPAPLPAEFDVMRLVDPLAVAAIRKSFLQSKTSRNAWQGFQREGRCDIRQAPRAVRGEQDVFRRKAGVSTTRVKCSVLMDASGSMGGLNSAVIANPTNPQGHPVRVTRLMAAAVFGATIANAIGRIPTVDLDVFQHSAGTVTGSLHVGDNLYMKWRWHKGTPAAVFNGALGTRPGGGNADGHAIVAVAERMKREIRRGERGIIMVVSDGLPSVTGVGSTAGQALLDGIAHARKLGFEVIGVAIDGSAQSNYYGKDGVVPFAAGNWTGLGKALGAHIGKLLATR